MPGIEEFTSDFFDQSSESWLKNKMRKGHSMAYLCNTLTREGKQCTRAAVMKDVLSDHKCTQHQHTVKKRKHSD